MTEPTSSLENVPGLQWSPRGYAGLSGALYDLAGRLQAAFDRVAATWSAEPIAFPPFLPVTELQRIDYFGSFPHLASFPMHLDGDDDAVARFAADPIAGDGSAALMPPTPLAPAHEVLTPAACYHLYVLFRGDALASARYLTTTATCYRREAYYRPLERQWAFTMREVVAIATPPEVAAFLAAAREQASAAAAAAGLPVRWEHATDPFFRPSTNPQYLMQRIDPTKYELVYGDGLAIASINLHHDHFGRAFAIDLDGVPATTGCLAFGVERWLAAIIREHGADAASWPELTLAETANG